MTSRGEGEGRGGEGRGGLKAARTLQQCERARTKRGLARGLQKPVEIGSDL